MPFTTPSDFDVKTFYKGNATKLVAPLGVTMKAEGIKNLGQEPRTKATIYGVDAPAVTVQVDGTGARHRGGDDQQSADSGGQSRLMQILRGSTKTPTLPEASRSRCCRSNGSCCWRLASSASGSRCSIERLPMADDAIVLEGVWKYFGDYPAIRNVSFRLAQSQCLALIGRNGAGKTTRLCSAAFPVRRKASSGSAEAARAKPRPAARLESSVTASPSTTSSV